MYIEACIFYMICSICSYASLIILVSCSFCNSILCFRQSSSALQKSESVARSCLNVIKSALKHFMYWLYYRFKRLCLSSSFCLIFLNYSAATSACSIKSFSKVSISWTFYSAASISSACLWGISFSMCLTIATISHELFYWICWSLSLTLKAYGFDSVVRVLASLFSSRQSLIIYQFGFLIFIGFEDNFLQRYRPNLKLLDKEE